MTKLTWLHNTKDLNETHILKIKEMWSQKRYSLNDIGRACLMDNKKPTNDLIRAVAKSLKLGRRPTRPTKGAGQPITKNKYGFAS
jgi:hypothetical protein